MNQPRDRAGRFGRTPERPESVSDLSGDRLAEARAAYGDFVSDHHIELPAPVENLLDRLRAAGMNPLLVGGSVRDSFDGTTSKDLDFEVYGASTDQLHQAASEVGQVNAVGKKYGVLKMTLGDEDIDLSVPRRDNKTGVGHRDFTVDVDPGMSVTEASSRRDFTINAMSYDPRLGVLIDPHGGRRDLEDGVLRHVSPAFAEDPLRVIRGMQFAARFNMTMDPDTVSFSQSLRVEASSLHNSGMSEEWAKWARKSRRPSDGLRVLAQTEWDREFDGLAEINDAQLRNDVDSTLQVLRESQAYAGRFDERVVLAAVIMRRMDSATAAKFASRTIEGGRAQRRARLIAHDERPLPATPEQAREQAYTGATVRERCLLVAGSGLGDRAAEALRLAAQEGVTDAPEADLVSGEDIMAASAGVRPGHWIADTVARVRVAQARGEFRDRVGALSWLQQNPPTT